MPKNVVVIGGGINGLAISALLAKSGFEVTLLEKNKGLGGRAMIYKTCGFTFDAGPSFYLMPEIFKNFFQNFNQKPQNYYQLVKVNPLIRIFIQDKKIDIPNNFQKTLKLFKKIEPNGDLKLLDYINESKNLYQVAQKFLYKNPRSIKTFLNLEFLKHFFSFALFQSQYQFVLKKFTNPILQKILLFHTYFLGGEPKLIPKFYSLLSYAIYKQGVYYPKGGFSKIVQGLIKLNKKLNVKFITNSEVKKILISQGKIIQIKTSRKTFSADIFVSTIDYPYMETKLLPPTYQTYPKKYWQTKRISLSVFIIMLGLKRKVKNLAHHNLFFSDNSALDSGLSFYVSCPTKTDSSISPKDCDLLYILAPMSKNFNQNKNLKILSKKIITHLEKLTGEELQNIIKVKKIISLNDFKNLYNSYKGTALGLTHTLFQSFTFRPSYKSQKLKNLYYSGQYTYPGIGVPMVLVSAENAAKQILKDYGK